MSLRRVAVVFDPRPRPETTGVYCLRALESLGEARHFLPDDVASADLQQFDLCLRIDDGLRCPWPEIETPSAYWAIDTHMDFKWALEQSRKFDFVFAAQRNGAQALIEQGISKAEWLPLACDPELHRGFPQEKIWEVGFVGHPGSEERARLLERIRATYPESFLGTCDFREMAAVYAQAKIVFNRSVRDDVNMRVFEALASGSLLITNELPDNGLAELFQDQVHLVTYQDERDLFANLDQYLADEPARERIAQVGQQEVLAKHTYAHRMQQLLASVERQLTRSGNLSRLTSENKIEDAPEEIRPEYEDANAPTPPRVSKRRIQDPGYFEFARPEMLNLVPRSARRVLEIGCGAGRLGESLKQRQETVVVGIELDAEAAALAAERLDRVLCGNIEAEEFDFTEGEFDAVICADVLEHLREPESVLEKLRHWLSPEGVLVASLPNVRHHSVLRSLLHGNWTYEPAGLLDGTHLRFYTRREIEKQCFRAGWDILKRQAVPGPGYDDWVRQGRPTVWEGPGLRYQGRTPEEVEEFFTYQHLIVARPAPLPAFGLTSIVLVTHNELAYTQRCLASVRYLTDEPYELIVVDNGSTDGTPDWLSRQPDVRLIPNAENRGFPAAVNQGLAVAQGEQILLLNNDTLATTGWLRRMLDCLASDPTIGLVGPCSNQVSGEQQIPVDYDQLADLDGFAWDWGQSQRGNCEITDRLVGFCLLIRRAVIDQIGLFDERFGLGCFEDDDYCRRAIQAGFRCAIARDAFVHHFGSRTFLGSGVDFAGILTHNQNLFEAKWRESPQHEPGVPAAKASKTPVQKSSPTAWDLEIDTQGAFRLVPKPVRLSLCMIVRDNERTIRPCLESIRPYVDEMIVVDTGSTDKTPDICRELGARVEHFPWCDDFSAARNESLKYARGEWLFWMDSDDTIPADCGRKLRELADGSHASETLGYVMQVHCPGKDAHDVTIVDHVKLFRNRPDLRFEFRIHEQILPAIRRAGGDVGWTDLYVVHSGSDPTPEGQAKKLVRDFRILERDLAERPDHPFVLFNLGMTCSEAGRLEDAEQYLKRCLEVSHPRESHLRKAYAILVAVLVQKHEPDQAYQICQAGLDRFPADRELLFRRAMLHHAAGQCELARDDYLTILAPEPERHFSSRDVGILGYKARHNLALVYEDMGQRESAAAQWRAILQERSDYGPAQAALRQFGSAQLM